MIMHPQLTHRFVRSIPKELEPGVLYLSMEYATAIHSCCCGCGNQVVTPLSPTDWQMYFDGISVSLTPSIGNWSFPCQSHYFITKGKIVEAARWNKAQIQSGREQDRINKQRIYKSDGEFSGDKLKAEPMEGNAKGVLRRLLRWISGK
jgi:hypothetical protein